MERRHCESSGVRNITSVYLKEGKACQTISLTIDSKRQCGCGQMNADESQWHWLCLSSHLMTHLQKKKIQARASLSKTKTALRRNIHGSCWFNLLWRCGENVQRRRQNMDWLQWWPKPSGGLLCKAAAHGSPPLTEKLFWLWEPLKLLSSRANKHHTKSYVKFITANSTHKTHSNQVGGGMRN